ncbi:MAG: response regulator transcription factor [Lachnospiraceae bacterium]|nr:response regulator transcription factor [Lachnospiraceae bacterium]
MKLLLAEDEVDMSEALVDILTFHKYIVDAVYDGQDALDYARLGNYDGIILDIMMPKKDGLTVLKELRSSGSQVPVLMLTAKSEIEDKVAGLDLGADDYLAKPFVMDELLARLRAMLRRREKTISSELTCGNVSLNQQTFELKTDKDAIILPKLEFQVMEMFMLNQEMYISADNILEKVWGYDTDAEISTVWVYISYLRKKLSQLKADIEIQAKRNIGYRLEKI